MDPSSIATLSANLRGWCAKIASTTVAYADHDSRVASCLVDLRSGLTDYSNILQFICRACERHPSGLINSNLTVWATISDNLSCSEITLCRSETAVSAQESSGLWGSLVWRVKAHLLLREILACHRDLYSHRVAANVALRAILLCLDVHRVASQQTIERSADKLRVCLERLKKEIESTPTEKREMLRCLRSLFDAAQSIYTDVVTRPLFAGQNNHQQSVQRLEHCNPPPAYTEVIDSGLSIINGQRSRMGLLAPNEAGHTPVHAAATSGSVDILEVLFNNGADLSALAAKNETPLYFAVNNNHLDAVRYILEHGGDFSTPTADGMTPLYAASYKGYTEIVRLLLERGVDCNRATGRGWTPINAASRGGHFDVVQLLLQHGADPSIREATGQTALYSACIKGHREIVKLLMEHE